MLRGAELVQPTLPVQRWKPQPVRVHRLFAISVESLARPRLAVDVPLSAPRPRLLGRLLRELRGGLEAFQDGRYCCVGGTLETARSDVEHAALAGLASRLCQWRNRFIAQPCMLQVGICLQ